MIDMKSKIYCAFVYGLPFLGVVAFTGTVCAQNENSTNDSRKAIYGFAPSNVLEKALLAEGLAASRLVWTPALRNRLDRAVRMQEGNLVGVSTSEMIGEEDYTFSQAETNCYAVVTLLCHSSAVVRSWACIFIGGSPGWAIDHDMNFPDAKNRNTMNGLGWRSDVCIPLLERSLFDVESSVRRMARQFYYYCAYPSEERTNAEKRLSILAATQSTNMIAIEMWASIYTKSNNPVPPELIPLVDAYILRQRAKEFRVYFQVGYSNNISANVMQELNKMLDEDLMAMGIPKEDFERCRNYAHRAARLWRAAIIPYIPSSSSEVPITVPPISADEQKRMDDFLKKWEEYKRTHSVNIP